MKKLRIQGPDDEDYDEQIDEESENAVTDRLLAENYKSPRNKTKRK
jgi:hypothetical protein